MALGFMTAVCVIWLLTPRTHEYLKFRESMKKQWNTGALDIKEPEILKVSSWYFVCMRYFESEQ